ncbi:MAG: hypothetical protein SH809_03855 [Rhodothermales bacterium]|nr:hypothetical protein [Rhodothermales bacterium]
MPRQARRLLRFAVWGLLLVLAGWAAIAYHRFTAAPTERLAEGAHYPDFPPDDRLHYLSQPLDHTDPGAGQFVGFYRLSPHFSPKNGVVFVLTDGQQPLVGPGDIPDVLADKVDGLSYIVMGRRGHDPTLFPEVYHPDGSLDRRAAVNLYGSWQHVEDIERVRQDAARKGLLPADGRIMLYGGSGGGVLVQQFLARYGTQVSRALIEVTGAPDLARTHHLDTYCTFVATTQEHAPESLDRLQSVLHEGRFNRASLLFMLQRIPYDSLNAPAIQRNLIDALAARRSLPYLRRWMSPSSNLPLISTLLSVPSMDAARVRMFELLGEGLLAYPTPADVRSLNLMYEWTGPLLADFLDDARAGRLDSPRFDLGQHRSDFTGQVLVIAAARDHVYGTAEGRLLADVYPNARLAIFDDTHRMQRMPAFYRQFRQTFFTDGFESDAFRALMQDPNQLNRPTEEPPPAIP